MVGIFHSRDLDGFTSGAIIKHKYPNAILIGFDYGQQLPYDKIPKGEPVIMADVSLPMTEMLELAKHSGYQLTWIDHHISSIEDYMRVTEGGEGFLTAVLENGISACEGCWKHFFPDKEMPLAIRLLGEYDTWRKEDENRWNNEILPFQFGMRMICNSPETMPVWALESGEGPFEYIHNVIQKGETILAYQRQQNEASCKKAFPAEFQGLRAICLNGSGFNSDVFKSVYDESKHDIMMPFAYDGKTKQWIVSLYTTKKDIDCSAIAKKLGGGGHAAAAGFQRSEIFSLLAFM